MKAIQNIKAKKTIKKIEKSDKIYEGLQKEIDAFEILIKQYSREYNEQKSEKKTVKVQEKIDKLKEKQNKQTEAKAKMVKKLMMINDKMKFVEVDGDGKPIDTPPPVEQQPVEQPVEQQPVEPVIQQPEQVEQPELEVVEHPSQIAPVEQPEQEYPMEQEETPQEFQEKVLQQVQAQQQAQVPEEVIDVPRIQPEPQQPIQQEQPVQPRLVRAKIVLTDAILVDVMEQDLNDFISRIKLAMDNKTSVEIGNRLVNGVNITEVIVG